MADVFVFPSTTDTLGLVLLEALASGLPVVAADSPASRELLADCPVAWLFPIAEPSRLPELVRVALRPQSGPPAAVLARREAEKWGWAAAAAQLIDYYRAAIAANTVRTGGSTESSDTNRSALGQVTDISGD
jgi:glycosyltransferase involved in cell wall biosynthesis